MHDDEPMAPWGSITAEHWLSTGPPPLPSHPAASPSASTTPPAPAPATVPAQGVQPPAPPAYAERITAITATFGTPAHTDALSAAGIDAEQLDIEFTAVYGPHHPDTARLRDLRGWIAHLLGAPDVATQWFLHTTGLYCTAYGTGHPDVLASARRTVHTWSAIDDPDQAVALASEIMAMLAYLGTQESTALAQQVTTRLPPR